MKRVSHDCELTILQPIIVDVHVLGHKKINYDP